MQMIQIDLGELAVALILLIVWFARLEFKTGANEKNISKIETKHDTLEKDVVTKLSTVEQSLARIEGYLFKK